MNTAPQVEHKGKGTAPEPVTRLKSMEQREEKPKLPPVSAKYLIEWWLEIGPSTGEHVISWGELSGWQNNTGIGLAPWEAKAIRSMSSAFLRQQYDAKKADCPAPYVGDMELIKENRDKVAARVKAAFAANLRKAG